VSSLFLTRLVLWKELDSYVGFAHRSTNSTRLCFPCAAAFGDSVPPGRKRSITEKPRPKSWRKTPMRKRRPLHRIDRKKRKARRTFPASTSKFMDPRLFNLVSVNYSIRSPSSRLRRFLLSQLEIPKGFRQAHVARTSYPGVAPDGAHQPQGVAPWSYAVGVRAILPRRPWTLDLDFPIPTPLQSRATTKRWRLILAHAREFPRQNAGGGAVPLAEHSHDESLAAIYERNPLRMARPWRAAAATFCCRPLAPPLPSSPMALRISAPSLKEDVVTVIQIRHREKGFNPTLFDRDAQNVEPNLTRRYRLDGLKGPIPGTHSKNTRACCRPLRV